MAVESPGRADEAIEPIAPPPADEPVFAVPTPQPSSRRRRPNWLWYGSLLIAAVVTLGGFGLLYGDDMSWQRQAGDLARQNSSLHEELLTSQTSLDDSQHQVTSLQAELEHPHVGIWNVAQDIKGSDWSLAGGVPDTFTYHLRATSNGSMSVSILTFETFAAA